MPYGARWAVEMAAEDDLERLRTALQKAKAEGSRYRRELNVALEHSEELERRAEGLERDLQAFKQREQELQAELESRGFGSSVQEHSTLGGRHYSGSTGDTAEPSEVDQRLDAALRKLAAAEAARDAAIKDRDEAIHDKEEAVRQQNVAVVALQTQLAQLQKRCLQLHEAHQGLERSLEMERQESEQLRIQMLEMEEILDSHRKALETSSFGGLLSKAPERKTNKRVSFHSSLAAELAGLGGGTDSGEEAAAPPSPARPAALAFGKSSSSAPPGKARPMLRRADTGQLGSSTSRLQQLKLEYQATFEKQQKELEDAMRHKQALEEAKDRQLQELKWKLEALEGAVQRPEGPLPLRSKKASSEEKEEKLAGPELESTEASPQAVSSTVNVDAPAPKNETRKTTNVDSGIQPETTEEQSGFGFFGMLNAVKEFTLEASDAVVLNLAGVSEDAGTSSVGSPSPSSQRSGRIPPSMQVEAGSSARDRLKARRQKKASDA